MTDQIKETLNFVRKKFFDEFGSTALTKEQMLYRFEHTLRVAAIGQTVARAEKMNEEALVVACLLHDVGYCELTDFSRYREHGFLSAKIAEPFVAKLNFDGKTKRDILAGIASHVTGEADFPCELNAFTETVSDCDNIDRFDVFRIYDNLQDANFRDLPLAEQKIFVENKLTNFKKYRASKCATVTARKMWEEKLDFQILFYRKLRQQLSSEIK